MRQRLAASLILLALALALVPDATAHAVPVEGKTFPGFGERLQSSPSAVWISFSEHVDPAAVTLTIVNGTLVETPVADVTVDNDGLTVRATVDTVLVPGGYVLKWEVLSTTDGHRTFGAIPFGIGANATISDVVASGAGAIRVDAVAGKTMMFTGLALMAGVFSFWYLVLPRGFRKGHEETVERIGRIGGWLHLIGVIVFGFSQWQISGLSAADYFFGTRFGQGLNLRFLMGAVVLAGLSHTVARDDVPRWLWGGLAFLIGALFWVYGSFSHTAGFVHPMWLGALADALHLLAISAWAGGLVVFVVFLHELPGDKEGLVAHLQRVPLRFSNLALASVVVAVSTGMFMLWAVVGFDTSIWRDSVYGKVLIAKISVAALMILLGGWNKLRYVLRYARGQAVQTISAFRGNVQREVALGLVVFLLAGIMTNTSPALPTHGPDEDFDFSTPDLGQDRLVLEAASETYNWTVQFHPGPALGEETHYIVELFLRGQGVQDRNATRVWMVIENIDNPEFGQSTVDTNRTDAGAYQVVGSFFPIAGTYDVTVYARSNEHGIFQESVGFSFDV